MPVRPPPASARTGNVEHNRYSARMATLESQAVAAQPHRTRLFVLRMPRARWEFVAVAHLHGWSYVGERPAGAGNPHVIIMEVLPGITVWYWEFDDPRLCAVTVDSTLGPESIEPFATLVQATLVPFTLTELVEEIDNASDRVLGLWRAGFGAPDQVDPVFLSRFSAAAAAPDPAVRTAAIMAMTQTGWPQCGPVIEEIARTDSKRAVRQVAR